MDVRLVEAGRDEERAVAVLFEEAGHASGSAAVGLVLVAVGGGRPGPRRRSSLLPLLFRGGLPGLVPRQVGRVLGQVPLELLFEGAMVDLAHPGREVAVGVEVLLQRHRPREALAWRLEVVEHPRALRTPAGEERRTRRAAGGDLAVGAVEAPTLASQAVDGGRLDGRAVATDASVQVVRHHQEHVGPGPGDAGRGWSGRRPGREGDPRGGRARHEALVQLAAHRLRRGIVREVPQLAGVRVVIVELAAAVGPLRVAPALGPHTLAQWRAEALHRGDRRVLDHRPRILEQGPQAHAVETFGPRQAGQLGEGREDVDQLDQAVRGGAGLTHAGSGHDERGAQRLLEQQVRARPRAGRGGICHHDHERLVR